MIIGRLGFSLALALFVAAVMAQAPSQNATEVFREAFEHYKAKRYSEAEELFTRGLRDSPRDAQALFYLAEAKLALEKRSEARDLFSQAVAVGLPADARSRAIAMIDVLRCGDGQYSVRAGDTLRNIGQETGRDWRDIMKWNNLENANLLEVGMCLRIRPSAN